MLAAQQVGEVPQHVGMAAKELRSCEGGATRKGMGRGQWYSRMLMADLLLLYAMKPLCIGLVSLMVLATAVQEPRQDPRLTTVRVSFFLNNGMNAFVTEKVPTTFVERTLL